jgi:osmotically-inducible protein OsmY
MHAAARLAHLVLASLLLLASAPAADLPIAPRGADKADKALAAQVEARLAEDSHHLSPGALSMMSVEARRGLVILKGWVPMVLDSMLIESLTRSVDGVRAVRNDLHVPGEIPPCDAGAES